MPLQKCTCVKIRFNLFMTNIMATKFLIAADSLTTPCLNKCTDPIVGMICPQI